MGSGYSHFRKAQFPSIKPPMFSMSLTGRDSQTKDTLLLTYCPPEAAYVIQATLANTWPCGIRKVEELNPSCHGIMLHECPFASKNFRDVITVKNMMAQVIAELGRQGWLPLVGCDLQTAEDISTVIFYRGSQPIFTVEEDPVIVSINSDNQLVLQNLPSRRFGQQLCESLQLYEPSALLPSRSGCKSTIGITFDSFIWEQWSSFPDQMTGRRVLIETFKFLESLGYRLATNFKVKRNSDCFFFEPSRAPSLEHRDSVGDIVFASLVGKSLIAIVGDPDKGQENSISALFRRVIAENWPFGETTLDTSSSDFDVLEMPMEPWMCSFDVAESSLTRLMIAKVFESIGAEKLHQTNSQCACSYLPSQQC